ncbi:MAG TPA: hypothetical protein VJ782_05595 [Aeromicrobium sp.]|nr:hypothetical protein [Aeromicrobium sp.]
MSGSADSTARSRELGRNGRAASARLSVDYVVEIAAMREAVAPMTMGEPDRHGHEHGDIDEPGDRSPRQFGGRRRRPGAAQVRRVVLDADSTVIDFGQRQRLFTGNARLAATVLELSCHHNGCEVPAERSQIDHNRSHCEGGRTDQDNAMPRCGPHNRFKYRNRWRTRRADNGRPYNIRADGTIVLFIGERPPTFTHTQAREHIQRRLAELQTLRERNQTDHAA